MSTTVAEDGTFARHVEITEDELRVALGDGRNLTVPLASFPRLLQASPDARANWELLGNGEGIHWPEVDEDLSIHGSLVDTRPG